MKQIKYLAAHPLVWLIIFTVLYLVSRIVRIHAMPMFTDEAIYIRWAQIGGYDASWRFISLTDGKQPLFIWLMMAMLRLFSDPLLAGRMTSVACGLFGMIGMYFVANELFKNQRVGIIASLLYLLSPFALIYDRMALYDSLVTAFFLWNLYLSILLVRYVRLDIALIFGMSLGLAMLNKTSAFLSLYLLPVTLLLFDWKKKPVVSRLLTWLAYIVVSIVLSQGLYSILRLSPYFYIVAQKDALFIYPVEVWLKHPLTFLYGNLHGMFDWLITYLTTPVSIIALLSLVIFRQYREKLLLIGLWFIPFLGLALFGRVIYPRFIFFMAMPLLILTAYEINWILGNGKKKIIVCGIIGFILLWPVWNCASILSDIRFARIPKSDLSQYVNDWPAGWGVAEITARLQEETMSQKVSVYTEGSFGLMPYALEIYFYSNPNIEIHGLWPLDPVIPEDIIQTAKERKAYLVTYQSQAKPSWPLELIAEYQKGANPYSKMRLYRILP